VSIARLDYTGPTYHHRPPKVAAAHKEQLSMNLAIGQPVFYNLPQGKRRAAIIVNVLDEEKGIVDLTVFLQPIADAQAGFQAKELAAGLAVRQGVKQGLDTHHWSPPATGSMSMADIGQQVAGLASQVAGLAGSVEHCRKTIEGVRAEANAQVAALKAMQQPHPAAAPAPSAAEMAKGKELVDKVEAAAKATPANDEPL